MALTDRQTLLSNEQAVTVTAFSTDQYDTGNVTGGRNIGRSNADLRAVFTVDEAATASGSATVVFEIGEADDAAGTGFVALAASAAIGKAALTVGAKPFDVKIPDTTKRFIVGRYTVATGPLTAGKFTLSLQVGSDHQRTYPRGDNVSSFSGV